MSIWLLIIVQWVLLIAGIAAAEYRLNRRVPR
jgi:hypothetical protein